MVDSCMHNASHPSQAHSAKFNITNDCALFDFVMYTVLGGVMCFFGIIGNIVSFTVLWRDTSKAATSFLLRALAVADSLVLLAAIPLYVAPFVWPATGYLKGYYDLHLNIMPFLWPIYLIPYTGTILLTVLVSLNRYFAVCRPFRTSGICATPQAKKHVMYIALFAFFYNIPRFFEYEKVELCVGVNETKLGYDMSAFGKNRVYRIIYANILYFLVMHGGPLVSLAFLNVKLVMALKRRQQKRTEMGKGGYQQDITLVLVALIFVFIFCQTPTFIDHILWTFVAESARHCGNWHYYYTAIGDVLAILNSSVNFVIYILTSRKFRQGLLSSCAQNPGEFLRLHSARTDNMTYLSQTQVPVTNIANQATHNV